MLIQILFKIRPVLLNLLFIAYLWYVQPEFLAWLNASQEDHQGNWGLAAFLLAVPLFEIMGIFLKRPVSAYFSLHYPRTSKNGGNYFFVVFLFTSLFHLGLATFLVIVAFQVGWGRVTASMPDPLLFLMLVVLLFAIAKEAFLIVMAYPIDSNGYARAVFSSTNTRFDRAVLEFISARAPKQITLKHALRDLLGELLLLAFSALIYTTLWSFVTQGNQVDSGPAAFMDYLGLTFYFLLVYLPLRMVSLMEEMATQAPPLQRLVSAASLFAVWLAAILQIR